MRCVAHSASSACTWASQDVKSKDILKSVHVTISSCINTCTDICRQVRPFVISCTRFDTVAPNDFLKPLWSSLGVHDHMLAEMTFVCPMYEPEAQVLHVNRDLESTAGWVDRVAAVVLLGIRLREWSETRWACVGKRLRMLVLALCVG